MCEINPFIATRHLFFLLSTAPTVPGYQHCTVGRYKRPHYGELLKNSKNYRSGVIQNITHSNSTLFQYCTLPILHPSNPTLFQSYTLPILNSSNPTLFQSYTLHNLHSSNPTLFQSYTLPILNSSTLTLFQSYTLPISKAPTLQHTNTFQHYSTPTHQHSNIPTHSKFTSLEKVWQQPTNNQQHTM